MLPGQGGPSGEGHLRPEMVSLPRCPLHDCVMRRWGINSETRSVSFLKSLQKGFRIRIPSDGQWTVAGKCGIMMTPFFILNTA